MGKMFGLVMYEEYLSDILKKKREFDVRLYSTNVRGRIALVKSKTNLIYAFVDLISVECITYEDYVSWHISARYSVEDARKEILKNDMLGDNKIKFAYAYQFENIKLLEHPYKLDPIRKKGAWIEFNNEKTQKPYIQLKLF